MGTCFVIQPFDGGRFDKRYEDVFAPAIRAAGLEPYRVDRDPAVSVPIDDIEAGIESSDVVLADVTTDNPNVWFELGYAIAAQRDVVLVCSDERQTRFPFDVQHRNIERYSTESSSDFESLRQKIESRIVATLKRSASMGRVASIQSVASVEGLEQHHVATLVAVAEEVDDPTSGVSAYQIRSSMEKAGFTKLATTLGLKALSDMEMLESFADEDYNGNPFMSYRVTDAGMAWLAANQDTLTLLRPSSARASGGATPGPMNDIPF
jgi:Nucleoside 2-deoxyribosyltransferase